MNNANNKMFLPHCHDYNQNVTTTITVPHRKAKSQSSLRHFFSSMKARRKENKDTPTPTQEEPKQYLEEDHIRERILETDLTRLVLLPPGLDYNEWLATHTISFFEHINLVYGGVSEFCTAITCSTMTAPANLQYLWLDEKGKKCKCAAPQYVDYVMSFSQKTIQDEAVFPTKFGQVFPSTFEMTVKKLYRYMFHVMAHMYQAHYKELLFLGLQPHLNLIFQHFMLFSRHFNLLDDKDSETHILDDLFIKLQQGAAEKAAASAAAAADTANNKMCHSGSKDSGDTPMVVAASDAPSGEENKENENRDQNVVVGVAGENVSMVSSSSTMAGLATGTTATSNVPVVPLPSNSEVKNAS